MDLRCKNQIENLIKIKDPHPEFHNLGGVLSFLYLIMSNFAKPLDNILITDNLITEQSPTNSTKRCL